MRHLFITDVFNVNRCSLARKEVSGQGKPQEKPEDKDNSDLGTASNTSLEDIFAFLVEWIQIECS
jgi:hypothetical protein